MGEVAKNSATDKKSTKAMIERHRGGSRSKVPKQTVRKAAPVQKENDSRTQQPVSTSGRSGVSSTRETHTSISKLGSGSGGNRIAKPVGSKDLASKRAAYFESLMQKQE